MPRQSSDDERLFFTLFHQLVLKIWATPHDERLKVANETVRKIFRPVNSNVLDRIANTALRVVAFAESWHSQVREKYHE